MGDDFVPEDLGDITERDSFWRRVFSGARATPGQWVLVNRMYTSKFCLNRCSDIRCAHVRDVPVTGILPGERWDADWRERPGDPPDNYRIYVRFLGRVDD